MKAKGERVNEIEKTTEGSGLVAMSLIDGSNESFCPSFSFAVCCGSE